MITLTERAVKKALALAAREEKAKVLRVGVRGGGCSGLSYFLDFIEPDTVRPEDEVLERDGLKIVCDKKSLKFIDQMTVDYETNLMAAGFKFQNPNAKKSCSCGESFTVS